VIGFPANPVMIALVLLCQRAERASVSEPGPRSSPRIIISRYGGHLKEAVWQCSACSFQNEKASELCEMCITSRKGIALLSYLLLS